MNTRVITSLGLLLIAGHLFAQSETLQADKTKPVVAKKPAKTYLLQYRFQTGEMLHYRSNFKMTMITAKGKTVEKVVSKTEMRKHFKVMSARQGKPIVLEPILDHVKMSVKFNKSDPVTYDSSSKKEPPKKFEHVVESIGTAMVQLKVGKQGKLLDVIPQKTKKERSVITLTKGDRVNQMSQKSFLVKFPENQIQVGDSWGEILHSTVSMGRSRLRTPIKLKRSYRLKSIKNNIATIAMQTYLLTNIRDPQQRVQLIQRKPRGTILFDIKKGILISRKTTIDEQVFGIAGDDSYMKATSQFEETFVEKN